MLILTNLASKGSLTSPQQNVVRFETLENSAVQPIALSNLVNRFFYAYRKGTGLFRAFYHFMVGIFLGAVSVLTASQPLKLSRHPRFNLVGGYSTLSESPHELFLPNRH